MNQRNMKKDKNNNQLLKLKKLNKNNKIASNIQIIIKNKLLVVAFSKIFVYHIIKWFQLGQ